MQWGGALSRGGSSVAARAAQTCFVTPRRAVQSIGNRGGDKAGLPLHARFGTQ
jgi:hypothetical protein